jgi:hypothetical protein
MIFGYSLQGEGIGRDVIIIRLYTAPMRLPCFSDGKYGFLEKSAGQPFPIVTEP